MSFLRRASARRAAVLAVSACTIAGVVVVARGKSDAATPKSVSITADAFNAAQDTALLQRALRPTHAPWPHDAARSDGDDFALTFYRLLGCPFCAKVESVLQYHRVPYTEHRLDPIRGGAPDPRYTLAPQLRLTPRRGTASQNETDDDKSGVFVVDSETILASIARPLRYERDWRDARTQATRQWITSRFSKSSFVVANGTLRDAYATFTYTTPPCWHWPPYRLLGAAALHALARYKVKPQLAQQHDASADTTAAHKTSEQLLRDDLAHFASLRPPHAPFHGGATPDLADVEMYGVTRVVAAHPRLGAVVNEGAFGEWHRAMAARMPQT